MDKKDVIDLSWKTDKESGMDFKQNDGKSKCKKCRGVWPLIVELDLCKMCIFRYIPREYRNNKDIIAPKGYRENESYSDECTICYEKFEDGQTIWVCDVCNCHIHDTCKKKMEDTYKKCPVCNTPFSS